MPATRFNQLRPAPLVHQGRIDQESVAAAVGNRSPWTVSKRAGSFNLYLRWYLNQTSLDSESLEETSVWLYMVHLRRSGAPASRGASLLRALRFLHHVMGFNLDSMLRSRRVGGIAEQMSVGVEWLIGKLRR